MRRPCVRRLVAAFASGGASGPLAQPLHLAAQACEILGQFEHRLVLLDHVALEVGDLFFEEFNAVVQRKRAAWFRTPRPSP